MGTCDGVTKTGTKCKLRAKRGKTFCHLHLPITAISNTPDDNFRELLSELEEVRDRFVGTFKRVGSKPGTLTILLTNIFKESDPLNILSDHSWFNFTKGFHDIGYLKEGDKISFTARIKRYEKGYGDDKSFDYKFSLPLSVSRVQT